MRKYGEKGHYMMVVTANHAYNQGLQPTGTISEEHL